MYSNNNNNNNNNSNNNNKWALGSGNVDSGSKMATPTYVVSHMCYLPLGHLIYK